MARPGPLPAGDYSFELSGTVSVPWSRATATSGALARRGWDMTALLPELADLPADGVFDGELVAFADGVPYFPLVCERLLHGHRDVALTFVVFDVLELDGEVVMDRPFAHRRRLLDELELRLGPWFVADARGRCRAVYGCL